MVAIQADKIVRVPLNEAVSTPKLVPHEFYEEVAKPLFRLTPADLGWHRVRQRVSCPSA